ncbi:IST1 homolog isoform X5 [Phyllostomus discolor]|uniref:IST1 homolog n=1 Tax=Phyllostomus discolor TaxID=89673 RepID=A0A7E6CMB9_9CHIR|nr:IST1 homolog isoform X5 [Phyllostomus discolor]
MFSSAFKADRLRANLQLAVSRLKLLERKKTEQAQKARKEIADYLAAGKDERARIRVEHIIREDYLVEAMEILELYCGLLLARFGLIQTTQELDSGLAESVSTLIWAAPRLQSEVPELKIVSNQLCAKYSQEYGRLCRTSEIGTVSPRLMCKLNVDTLPQVLVEQYLIEIAKNYNVPYKSQATIMNDSYKNNLPPILVPGPRPNLETSPKPASRTKIGFDNFMPDLPDAKPQASLSIDPYDSEEVDFEDLDRRLEILKKAI